MATRDCPRTLAPRSVNHLIVGYESAPCSSHAFSFVVQSTLASTPRAPSEAAAASYSGASALQ
jgi:hypothetical protein